MKSIIQSELHDAKLKLIDSINSNDKVLIRKLEQVIKELENSLRLLDK